MRTIDADALYTLFVKMKSFGELTAKKAIRCVEEAPTVDAIIADDNFGFAGYIVTNDENGYRVEESWNPEMDDEQMMCVMCGVIQDIKADERLSKLWMRAMDLADFMMEGDTDE